MQRSDHPGMNEDAIRAKTHWPWVLAALGRTHPALRAALRNAAVCASEGNIVVLGHPTRHCATRLMLPKVVADIETTFRRTTGEQWSVYVMVISAAPTGA